MSKRSELSMCESQFNREIRPMPEELSEKVRLLISKAKRISLDRISIDSSLEELGIDSLGSINVIFELENEFDITITDEEVRSIKSVAEVVEGVKRLLTDKITSTEAR
jgi:acyl carrier protein